MARLRCLIIPWFLSLLSCLVSAFLRNRSLIEFVLLLCYSCCCWAVVSLAGKSLSSCSAQQLLSSAVAQLSSGSAQQLLCLVVAHLSICSAVPQQYLILEVAQLSSADAQQLLSSAISQLSSGSAMQMLSSYSAVPHLSSCSAEHCSAQK